MKPLIILGSVCLSVCLSGNYYKSLFPRMNSVHKSELRCSSINFDYFNCLTQHSWVTTNIMTANTNAVITLSKAPFVARCLSCNNANELTKRFEWSYVDSKYPGLLKFSLLLKAYCSNSFILFFLFLLSFLLSLLLSLLLLLLLNDDGENERWIDNDDMVMKMNLITFWELLTAQHLTLALSQRMSLNSSFSL